MKQEFLQKPANIVFLFCYRLSCFYCGLTLDDLKKQTEWEKYFQYNPSCIYMVLEKGQR